MKNREVGLKRELNTVDLALYGLIIICPVAPFAWYGTMVGECNGMVALGYFTGMIAMLFTGFSYVIMSHQYPVGGSVYSYVQRSVKPEIGFMAGWAMLFDYLLCPAACMLVGANFLSYLVPEIPVYATATVLIIVSTGINLTGIKSTKILTWAVFIASIIDIIWFVAAAIMFIAEGKATGTVTTAFYNANAFDFGGVLKATILVVVSYLGFDAISTFADEAKNPRKTVGNATLLCLVFISAIFILVTWLAGIVHPDSSDLDSATAFLDIMLEVSGMPLVMFTIALMVVMFGITMVMDNQAAGSRLVYRIAIDGILPGILGKLNGRHVPGVALISIAVFNAVVSFTGLEAVTHYIAFGALIGFMCLNISVIVKMFVKNANRSGKTVVKYLISPIFGFVICFAIWINMDKLAFIFGGLWLAIGCVIMIVKTKFFTKPIPTLSLDE